MKTSFLLLRKSLSSRAVLVLLKGFLLSCAMAVSVVAAPADQIAIKAIKIAPDTMTPGRHPEISASIKVTAVKRPRKTLQINVVATVTQPDKVMRSWQWKKIKMARGETKAFTMPKNYDIRLAGAYKVEYVIYSSDMKRRLSRLSRTFTVAEQPKPPSPAVPQEERKGPQAVVTRPVSRPAQERAYLGAGLFANTLNPAGGATVLIWPFKNVGLQGSYTVGTFTSYEGRLLAKFELSPRFNPYLGVGFLHVSKTSTIIGIETTFTDSNVSGVVGVEVPLGRRMRGYLEVSGTKMDLEKVITDGSQTVLTTVDYAPVTIGISLVYLLF